MTAESVEWGVKRAERKTGARRLEAGGAGGTRPSAWGTSSNWQEGGKLSGGRCTRGTGVREVHRHTGTVKVTQREHGGAAGEAALKGWGEEQQSREDEARSGSHTTVTVGTRQGHACPKRNRTPHRTQLWAFVLRALDKTSTVSQVSLQHAGGRHCALRQLSNGPPFLSSLRPMYPTRRPNRHS